MFAKLIGVAVLVSVVAACGDKVPESEEARKIGNIPKQTIDNAKAKTDAAIQAGAERTRDADKKSE